jgi:hypothetical protein
MKNLYRKSLGTFAILGVLGLASCEDDEYTDYSVIEPTNPTVTLEMLDGDIGDLDDSMDSTFNLVRATLSEPQVVDVAVYLNPVNTGTAVAGVDYSFPDRIIIPAGETSATATLSVLENCDISDEKNIALELGSIGTANATLTQPLNYNRSILNYESPEVSVSISWEPDAPVYNANTGALLNNASLVDVDLQIIDPNAATDDERIVASSGTSGFETATFDLSDLANGTYSIVGKLFIQKDDKGNITYDGFNYSAARNRTYQFSVEVDRCGVMNKSYVVTSPENNVNGVGYVNDDGTYNIGDIIVNNGNITVVNDLGIELKIGKSKLTNLGKVLVK